MATMLPPLAVLDPEDSRDTETLDIRRPPDPTERIRTLAQELYTTDGNENVAWLASAIAKAAEALTHIAYQTGRPIAWVDNHPIMILYAAKLAHRTQCRDLTKFVGASNSLREIL